MEVVDLSNKEHDDTIRDVKAKVSTGVDLCLEIIEEMFEEGLTIDDVQAVFNQMSLYVSYRATMADKTVSDFELHSAVSRQLDMTRQLFRWMVNGLGSAEAAMREMYPECFDALEAKTDPPESSGK